MLGTPYQTKLTFLANLLTILRILLQWKLDYDSSLKGAISSWRLPPSSDSRALRLGQTRLRRVCRRLRRLGDASIARLSALGMQPMDNEHLMPQVAL